jgi:hypothetical protein
VRDRPALEEKREVRGEELPGVSDEERSARRRRKRLHRATHHGRASRSRDRRGVKGIFLEAEKGKIWGRKKERVACLASCLGGGVFTSIPRACGSSARLAPQEEGTGGAHVPVAQRAADSAVGFAVH